MENWKNILESFFNFESAVLLNMLLTVLILIILSLLRFGLLRLAYRRTEDIKTRYNWRKFTGYLLYILLAILILPLWLQDGSNLTTYLGLVSAGLAIVLKDPLVNLAGWFFIVWRHPFWVGDRIEIGEDAGDVIDVRVFQFSLMEIGNWVGADQSTGRIIHIPNGMVFTLPLANYTRGFNYIWNEIPITITFESDWKKAKAILKEISVKHNAITDSAELKPEKISGEYQLFYKHLTPTVYVCGSDFGVQITIRYLCDPRNRRGSSHAIWEAVFSAFAKHADISFAYPTYRYVGDTGLPWREG